MKIKVSTVDTELEFETANKTRAKELFHQVSRNLGVHEHWYFGLLHDTGNIELWIDASKKAITQYKNIITKLKFRVKFFPENIEELIEEITIRYFYLQVRGTILADKLYCPPDTCVLLASYALQARYGDCTHEYDSKQFMSKENLLPKRVLDQHKVDEGVLEESIVTLWKKHKGLMKEDAMVEYLKITQNLEMFGVHYYEIQNAKKSTLLLGVTALGLNIYKQDDKLNPTIQFPWAEIGNINFRGTKFTIKLVDKKSKPFVFFSNDAKINKRILTLSVGYHTLYIKRRKPDSLEMVRMKAKAAERKQHLAEQRRTLMREINAREEVELREKRYLKEIDTMRNELTKSRQNLLDAETIIQRLREQLEELKKSKEKLEKQQEELKEMLRKLEEIKNSEQAEKAKLEEEIRLKQEEILRAQQEVAKRDEEARRLQEAMEEARRHEEEMRLRREEEMRVQRELEEQARLEEERLAVLKAEQEKAQQQSAEDLKQQIKIVQSILDEARDETKDTANDRIHRQNLLEGRDKYQTLANIRKGNTVRRVDMFENL